MKDAEQSIVLHPHQWATIVAGAERCLLWCAESCSRFRIFKSSKETENLLPMTSIESIPRPPPDGHTHWWRYWGLGQQRLASRTRGIMVGVSPAGPLRLHLLHAAGVCSCATRSRFAARLSQSLDKCRRCLEGWVWICGACSFWIMHNSKQKWTWVRVLWYHSMSSQANVLPPGSCRLFDVIGLWFDYGFIHYLVPY